MKRGENREAVNGVQWWTGLETDLIVFKLFNLNININKEPLQGIVKMNVVTTRECSGIVREDYLICEIDCLLVWAGLLVEL